MFELIHVSDAVSLMFIFPKGPTNSLRSDRERALASHAANRELVFVARRDAALASRIDDAERARPLDRRTVRERQGEPERERKVAVKVSGAWVKSGWQRTC